MTGEAEELLQCLVPCPLKKAESSDGGEREGAFILCSVRGTLPRKLLFSSWWYFTVSCTGTLGALNRDLRVVTTPRAPGDTSRAGDELS